MQHLRGAYLRSPLQRDALRVIQDIVVEAMGSPLSAEAVRRVHAVLTAVAAGTVRAPSDTQYSSREATILFADLRGFSALTTERGVDTVLGVLNQCFSSMVEIVDRHYGTVDKFMGDAIMVIFHGDPKLPTDHARRAVLCGVEMQIAMQDLRTRHLGVAGPALYMGIGINTGTVMAGLIGSDTYRAYTVIGEAVNVAARMEALSLRGQVLMSEATYGHCKDFVHASKPMNVYVKGRSQELRVFEALGIPSLGKLVPRQDIRKSPRVAVRLDVEYWPLSGKLVTSEGRQTVIRDIGYQGLLLELPEQLPVYSELKLAFYIAPLGINANNVYARLVSVRKERGKILAGIEFTSLPEHTSKAITRFVQMLLQGEYGTPSN